MKNKVILKCHLSCALKLMSSNVIPFFCAKVHSAIVVFSLPTFLSLHFPPALPFTLPPKLSAKNKEKRNQMNILQNILI